MPSPAEKYAELVPERQPYEYRAMRCAALSLPYLFTREGHTGSDDFPTPFQSNLANGVNGMASAMSLAILPPGVPFFKYELDSAIRQELAGLQDQAASQGMPQRPLTEVEQSLATRERAVMRYIERGTYRTGLYQALRYLLVIGNALVEHLPSGGLRNHRFRNYVVERNPDDSLYCLVIREEKRRNQIKDEVLTELVSAFGPAFRADEKGKIPVYTQVELLDGRYTQIQQIGDLVLDGEEDVIEGKIEDCPFWPQRFIRVDGEHYGRSHVEEYYGDGSSLDVMSQALVEASAIAAKVLFLLRPGGTTSADDLSKAPNGAFRSGEAADVTTLRLDKANDMKVAFEMWGQLATQVNRAFAVPDFRDAERVTAEEVRFLMQQLERNLGGSFPLLASDFQMPLAYQGSKRVESAQGFAPLKKGVADPAIITGIAALGRSAESERLAKFAVTGGQVVGPAAFAETVDQTELLRRLATNDGIEPEGLVRSQEQIAQSRAQAQQQMMAAEAAKTGGKMLTKATPEGALGGTAAEQAAA